MYSKEEKLETALKADYMKWNDTAEHGSASAAWTDGRELNYIRKKILLDKAQMEETGFFPECYYFKTPEEMHYKWMANPEEIRSRAEEALEKYRQDGSFQYILANFRNITAEDRAETGAEKLAKAADGLEKGIRSGDYLLMKRYSGYDRAKPLIEKCRKSMEELITEYEELGIITGFVKAEGKIPF